MQSTMFNSAPTCSLFDTGELTEKLVALLCRRKGIAPDSAALIPMEQYRQQQFDLTGRMKASGALI